LLSDNEYMIERQRWWVRLNSDYSLIRKIQRRGDRSAADELIQKYYDDIHNFVRRQTPTADIALDLTQEAFIGMLRTIGGYDSEKGAGFRTWLYRIATNKIADYYRSRSSGTVEILSLETVEPIDASDIEQRLEKKDFALRICEYVNELPLDTQSIFRLHLFGCYTFEEIADSLQMPVGSVKSRYYRLIKTIRKELEIDDG